MLSERRQNLRGLEQEIERRGAMPAYEVAAILMPICDALAHAHAAGVIHRDVKPSNILLCNNAGEESVKLIDFGIAKLIGNDGNIDLKNLTATGLFMGTPNYMAPERFLDKPCDGKTDVYSVGIVAYEMLTGSRPFADSGGNYMPVAMQHINDSPQPLRNRVPAIAPAMAELIASALAKEASVRPTAAEMARRLEAMIE